MSDDRYILDRYKGRRILIAPLNWGLGHATRCMPLVQKLSKHNHVCIASDGLALSWLKIELGERFPFYTLSSYDIKYDESNAWINLLKYGPVISRAISQEHHEVASIVKKEGIDLIISDHRLGVRHRGVESIIVAHQLKIPHQISIISNLASWVQRYYMNQFDQCWVPDHKALEDRLSGALAEPSLKIAKHFIGPLSHLATSSINDTGPIIYDIAVVLSGLEPARSILEEKLTTLLSQMNDLQVVCVQGTTLSTAKRISSNITYHNILSSKALKEIISQSKVVIARSGYSSIMDLSLLKKKAILIPTPNQPEQEYLATIHGVKNRYLSILEEDITLEMLKSSLLSLL